MNLSLYNVINILKFIIIIYTYTYTSFLFCQFLFLYLHIPWTSILPTCINIWIFNLCTCFVRLGWQLTVTIHIQIPSFLNWFCRDFDWLRTNFPSLRAMSVVNATSTIIPYEDYELMSSESCGGSNDLQAESCRKTKSLKRNRRAPIRFVDKLHEICSRDDLNNIICWNDGELHVAFSNFDSRRWTH